MKFAVDKNGLYSHYGTDGTIDFSNEFNENNQPFNHKYINGKWVLDKVKLAEEVSLKLQTKLDNLKDSLIYNETYIGTPNYEDYKTNILNEISSNRNLLNTLAYKTVDELLKI